MSGPKNEWKNRTKEYKDKERERKRRKYYENLKESRRKERERKGAQLEQNRDKINKRRREYYARNKEYLRKQINDGKIQREPVRGLETALKKFKKGDISFNELDRLYRERLALLHERDVQQSTGTRNKSPRRAKSRHSGVCRKSNKRTNENKT